MTPEFLSNLQRMQDALDAQRTQTAQLAATQVQHHAELIIAIQAVASGLQAIAKAITSVGAVL